MKAYSSEVTREVATPSVSSVIVESETALRSSAQSVFTFTSAMSTPELAMYTHETRSATLVGTKPAASVLAGNASIPAPTVVPATSAIEPSKELLGAGGEKLLRLRLLRLRLLLLLLLLLLPLPPPPLPVGEALSFAGGWADMLIAARSAESAGRTLAE